MGEGDHDERKYFGKYRGVVTDNVDPEKLLRVKCRVPELLGQTIITDWAYPTSLPYGGGLDYGETRVPPIGSGVYVEFESGSVNRPLYSGSWYGHTKGQSADPPQLTRESGQTKFSDDDSTKSPKGDDKFTAADCSEHQQPKSPAAPVYPNNQVLKTKENGIIVEIDDTPGKSRIHIFHGPSKSWFGLLPFRIVSSSESSSRATGDLSFRSPVAGSKNPLASASNTTPLVWRKYFSRP